MRLKDFFLNESHEVRKLSDSARKGFLGIVARYQEYGSKLKRAHPLSEIAKTLGVVAGAAERFTLSESDEWFDEITIRRNMKELKKYNAEFQKEARNAHKLELRMQALYEDMGRVLGRYYEVKELAELKDRVDESTKKTNISEGSDTKRLEKKLMHIRLLVDGFRGDIKDSDEILLTLSSSKEIDQALKMLSGLEVKIRKMKWKDHKRKIAHRDNM